MRFIQLPTGRDGRDEVSIEVTEIAAYRAHSVTTHCAFVEHVEVTLKSGVSFDCRIERAEFDRRLRAAYDVPLGVGA